MLVSHACDINTTAGVNKDFYYYYYTFIRPQFCKRYDSRPAKYGENTARMDHRGTSKQRPKDQGLQIMHDLTNMSVTSLMLQTLTNTIITCLFTHDHSEFSAGHESNSNIEVTTTENTIELSLFMMRSFIFVKMQCTCSVIIIKPACMLSSERGLKT